MFNKTIMLPGRTEYVPYEKAVTENRAPTDDSIRIYDEIKTKAYDSILDSIIISDNNFNAKAIVYVDLGTMSRVCKYSFTINGLKINDEVVENDFGDYDRDRSIQLIIQSASKRLARALLANRELIKSLK